MRAREQGELREGQNPRALARFLTCLLMGGTVLAKAGKKRKVFDDIVDAGLSVFE